jgi:hypothetical protein
VAHIDNDTIVIVNTRYFPSRGTTSDVGGIMSNNSKKKRVKARRIDMHKVIFSPELLDKLNTSTVRKDMLTHGTIKLTI